MYKIAVTTLNTLYIVRKLHFPIIASTVRILPPLSSAFDGAFSACRDNSIGLQPCVHWGAIQCLQ